MKPDPVFVWTSPGKPTVTRDLATTDTYLRMALGDTATTTARLMDLANGSMEPITLTYKGVTLEVRRLGLYATYEVLPDRIVMEYQDTSNTYRGAERVDIPRACTDLESLAYRTALSRAHVGGMRLERVSKKAQ